MPTPWLREPQARTLDGLLELSPSAATLRAYRDAVWSDPETDARLLELSRLRIGQLLGLDPRTRPLHPRATSAGLNASTIDDLARWPTSTHFGTRERAVLAFTEQWFLDPNGVTDDDCAAMRSALGEPGCAAFTMGLALSEALLRLELALGVANPAGGR
jgi:alkylhydroperoxidase family enzyme